MNLDSRQFLEAIGVCAVIISLLFVAFEIRQANRIAVATAEIEINGMAAELNDLRINNEQLRSIRNKIWSNDGRFEPTEDESELYYAYIARSFNLFLSREAAHRNGLLTDESMNRTYNDLERALNLPGNIPFYRQFVDNYPASEENPLIVYVKEILARHGPAST